MCNRIVFFGSMNNTKDYDLIIKAKEYLIQNKGNKFLYILPNGKLLTKYRTKLLEDIKGSFDLNVLTFDDIVNRLLSDEAFNILDSSMKGRIISNIIEKLYSKEKINYYKDLVNIDGFTNSISQIIGRIKRSLVDCLQFKVNIPSIPFYEEIALIYNQYQKFLNSNNFIDREEKFFKAIEMLNKNQNYFNKLDFIIIDKFFDFRPQELEILKQMCKKNIDIYINIPYKFKLNLKNYISVRRTLDILKDMGFEIVEVESGTKNYFENISDNLFVSEKPKFEKTDLVKVIKAPNIYLELKKICQEIKKCEKQGVKLDEIGIVITSSNEYINILHQVFREEKIPCSLNEEIRLIDVPLINEFLNLIELKINNFDKKSIIKRIKSSYFNMCSDDEKDKFEYMIFESNCKNLDELKNLIFKRENKIKNLVDEGKEEYKEKLDEIYKMKYILNSIICESESILEKGVCSDIIDCLSKILENNCVDQKIFDLYNKINDYDIFYRDFCALAKLKEIFNKIDSFSNKICSSKMSLQIFYKILIQYLKEETIITTVGNIKGINILTPINVRGLKFKVLFITGLVQGQYPKIDDQNFFFNYDNYNLLKEIGLDVKTYEEKLDKNKLLFSTCVASCEKYLYLSYTENTSNEGINIPSIFLEEFLNLFEGDTVNQKVNVIDINMNYLIKEDKNDITTKQEIVRHLLYKYYNEGSNEYLLMLKNIDENIFDKLKAKTECEIFRNREGFNKYNGLISDENIKKDIKDFQKKIKFSPTYFEIYGKCPYRFLLKYVFKIQPINEELEDFSALDKGNVYHEVLAKYYKRYNAEIRQYILNKGKFEPDDTCDEIICIIKEILNKNGTKEMNNLWKLRIENMVEDLLILINKDLERLRNNKFKWFPYEFEVEFGNRKDFILDLEDEKIKIVGRIDRIDCSLEKDKFILYDYKSSSYGIKKIKDILEGISFQLPLYIMSQRDRNVIAGGYINISKGETSIEILKQEDRKLLNKRKGKGVLSNEDWDSLMKKVKLTIKDYLEHIFNGNFSVNPKVCDKYCEFRDICRY